MTLLKDKCHLEDVFGGVEETLCHRKCIGRSRLQEKDAIEALVALRYSAESEAAVAVQPNFEFTEEMHLEDVFEIELKKSVKE